MHDGKVTLYILRVVLICEMMITLLIMIVLITCNGSGNIFQFSMFYGSGKAVFHVNIY